ncbi:MAG: alpha/beta hydrolase fold domain-containing protein [Bacilli bacterium]|nr:alpha/beta hydrolase fold domain-containing protein [Bacilli bacterium]
MIENEFDNDTKYRLFRTVREILHPTISKKNISDYIVIMSDETLPIRVFYPKKISNIKKIIIYVHGDGKVTSCHGKYSNICKDISIRLDSLVIGLEYDEEKPIKERIKDIEETIQYIYNGLEKNDKSDEDIILMGDSTGCLLIQRINSKELISKIKKEIFCYPLLSIDFLDEKYSSVERNMEFNMHLKKEAEEFFKKNTISNKKESKNEIKKLIIIGTVDSIIDGVKDYYKEDNNSKIVNIPFASHGFLRKMDQELSDEFYQEISDFL